MLPCPPCGLPPAAPPPPCCHPRLLPAPPHRPSGVSTAARCRDHVRNANPQGGTGFVSCIRMIAPFSLRESFYRCSSKQIEGKPKCLSHGKLQLKSPFIVAASENLSSRRLALFHSGVSLISAFTISCGFIPSPIKAEEEHSKDQEDEGDNQVFGTIKSLFDPNEKTKSGKILPKAYLKAAREVVKTLRESIEEDAKDVAKFRRNADAAKESIREYLNGWRGQKAVVAEESYVALEKAIRSLANFYSKAGPFGVLSEEVKSSILDDLNTAEASL